MSGIGSVACSSTKVEQIDLEFADFGFGHGVPLNLKVKCRQKAESSKSRRTVRRTALKCQILRLSGLSQKL